jgi:hypothetical protein
MKQVWIDDELDFRNEASHRGNVDGYMLLKKRHLSDNFMGDTLDTNKWAVSEPGSGDSIAISEVEGGSCLFTTGTVDDDSCMLGSAIIFKGSKYAVMEARVKISDVSGTGLFVGFSDAKSESNNSIAIHYPLDSLTADAENAVGFVIDADHSTSSIMCCGVKATALDTAVDSGIDWADDEVRNLRVELSSDEARFYIDGVAVGFIDDAVTSTTLLCATIQAMTRADDGSNTVYAYRINVWQDE